VAQEVFTIIEESETVSNKPDNIPGDSLQFLTIEELIKLYRDRASNADWALSNLILRLKYADRVQDEYERLILIIRDCLKYLDINDETRPLQERMIKALKDRDGG